MESVIDNTGIRAGATSRSGAEVAPAHECESPILLRLAKVHHRPNFDRAGARTRALGCPLNRLVEIVAIHHVVAAELFFGLGERTVSRHRLAVLYTYRGGGRGGMQCLARKHDAGLLHGLGVGHVFAHPGVAFFFGHVGAGLLVTVDEQQVLHDGAPLICWVAHSTPLLYQRSNWHGIDIRSNAFSHASAWRARKPDTGQRPCQASVAACVPAIDRCATSTGTMIEISTTPPCY